MKYLSFLFVFLALSINAQENKTEINSSLVSGLKFRNIGPAFSSGRIADIAIHPENENIWYVAVGSGSVWKTVNAGITWTPIFDDQPSYSIGCITIDPLNPNIIWVGSGENVGGRHLGYGDGVYKSMDGGRTWKNMGLKKSEHISEIIVHPANSDIVFVSSQGPLWTSGGERGLYKTDDGGKNWKLVLSDNDWTGVTDIALDTEDPRILYAATWQRHRTVAAYLGGGPGSGIHRSTDGGETWEKLSTGLPASSMGKIGIAVSPFDSDIIYAAITLDRRIGGVFISRDKGSSWKKQSDAVAGGTGPHYYQELYASPHHEGTIYLADVRIQVSDDHGKTFRQLNETRKHSDNHALTFRKDDSDYLLVGTDGGIYESFDLAENWRFIQNLPLTQYYKVAVDDAEPFYYVFGGTQDNGTHGGPSRTVNREGIRNADWAHILGADGHQTATEPGNPGIVYGESQQGGLHRIDRITGEQVFIQPQAGKNEPHERFNWDTPILVSAHDPARIYTASYRVWRSDNRGDSWETISGDLTKGEERIELPIMGRKQSWDNAWDIYAMSNYSTITSLGESPVQEGILYVGTDDGIIQITKDGGSSWKRIDVGSIKGIPETAFVNDIRADLFDAETVYAVLDNHKYGDFAPYIIKSTDAGNSWEMITEGISDRTLTWRIVQDHVKKDLLFAATEFGIYVSFNGGKEWVQMKGGLPTISFRDITIQRRENDLVAASFGRGFFILDDLSPLRELTAENLEKEAVLFDAKDTWLYRPRNVTVDPGASEYRADNPPFGVTFTYYLKEDIKSMKALRKEKEKKLEETESDIPFPGWEAVEAEKNEDEPFLAIAIMSENEKIVNHVKAPAKKGINRVTWDLSHANRSGLDLEEESSELEVTSEGFMVTPGQYSAMLYAVNRGEVKKMGPPIVFQVKPLYEGVLEALPVKEVEAYRKKLDDAMLEYRTVQKAMQEAMNRVEVLKNACFRLDEEAGDLLEKVYKSEARVLALNVKLNGQSVRDEVGEKQENTPGLRLQVARNGLSTSYGPTMNHKKSLELALEEMSPIKEELKVIMNQTIKKLEEELKNAGAPLIEDVWK
ncbi:WD40/YVTN/BNR-like repeat-containing protein [Bacteroidota bacterium]